MDITYTLSIPTLYAPEGGAVERVYWKLLADAGEDKQAVKQGEIELSPAGEEMTPFEELTEEQVMGWISDELESQMDDIKAELVEEIERLSKPPANRRPPWVSTKRGPKLRQPSGPRDTRPGKGQPTAPGKKPN